MKTDINYIELSNYIRTKFSILKHSETFMNVAADISVIMDRLSYNNITKSYYYSIDDLKFYTSFDKEDILIYLNFLESNHIIKKNIVNKGSKNILIYSNTPLFYQLKNEYIIENERDWKEFHIWNDYYSLYVENTNILDEFDAIVKLNSNGDKKLESILKRMVQSKVTILFNESDQEIKKGLFDSIVNEIKEFVNNYKF